MTSTERFRPDWVSPPGETISDILFEKALRPEDLAAALGQTTQAAHALLRGEVTITLGLARSLVAFLGGSIEFWMTRDLQYRDDLIERQKTSASWLSRLPLTDMTKFGWLKAPLHPSTRLDACLNFFGVNTVREWEATYEHLHKHTAFRTSASLESRAEAVAAWLRQGERQGTLENCGLWNPAGFKASLSQIRKLTKIKTPSLFLPKLQRYCVRNGVVASVVRAPDGCRASGAARFLSTSKAQIVLSFRYLTDDHFWFTFFHEAGHLILHRNQRLFLEGIGDESSEQETQANEFASQTLVPDPDALLNLRPTSSDVLRFAARIGVSPGIVVGQLQHHGRLRRDQLNGLKRRYRWS